MHRWTLGSLHVLPAARLPVVGLAVSAAAAAAAINDNGQVIAHASDAITRFGAVLLNPS